MVTTTLYSKTLHYQSGESISKVLLKKAGREDLASLQVAVRTGTGESLWNAWENITLGEIKTLTGQGAYLQVKMTANTGTTFYSKDARGVNAGLEIDILEVV